MGNIIDNVMGHITPIDKKKLMNLNCLYQRRHF